jgi:hypothetical protein
MTVYFNQFKAGTKGEELRLYGPRWNEKTCAIGRQVTLSKGYGKHERLRGVVTGFKKVSALTLSEEHQRAIALLYGSLDKPIAVISILVTNGD